ncbi:MAG: efflux RND transporter periplasmic adaptor subunit [Xanthobacteraceae bacterium]
MNADKFELLDTLRVDRTAPAPPRPLRWLAYTGGFAVLAAVAVAAWSLLGERAQTVRVAVAHALPKTDAPTAGAALLDATGYVVARRQATVGPKIAGKLRDVLVEEGMRVEAGQIIAHLDDSNALVAYNQAKASLDQAETMAADARPVFERSQAQVDKALISRDANDNAKSSFDQTRTAAVVARAALAVAKQNLDDTVVSAPFAGVVTVKAAQAGEIISPLSAGAGFTRTGIATIVDMDSLEVEVDVSENYINRVRPAQHCSVTLNAYADWQIPGHVIAVIPTADRTKATVRVRVGFDAKDPRILPEMGVRVAFLSDAGPGQPAGAPGGVTVPSEAVVVSGDQNVLFVVRDGSVERRAVKLGSRAAEGQIVLSGLSGGETIAVSGLDKLTDGSKVRIEQ